MDGEVLSLSGLRASELPADLRAETYFDFAAHPFAHEALFAAAGGVCGAIRGIGAYAAEWIATRIQQAGSEATVHEDRLPGSGRSLGHFRVIVEAGACFEPSLVVGSATEEGGTILVERGARIVGGVFDVEGGSIVVGPGSKVEAGAGLQGPTIVGSRGEIRQGAYLRGKVILGDDVTVRGEIKNAVLMDRATFAHPSYVGDSVCGYMTHFGNQATTANLGIFAGMEESGSRRTLVVSCDGRRYDLGLAKMGVCLGDFSQVGCNSVLDPATFLKPYTIAYALCRIPKGFYGPREILKNKPLEHGVIERAPLRD